MVKVKFISKAMAEKIVPSDDMALISIREPAEWVSLHRDWKNVLEVEFHDADPNPNPLEPQTNFGIEYDDVVYFDDGMADDVMRFVNDLPKNVVHLIVHCHAGISRSAAVAKSIVDLIPGFDWDTANLRDYRLYNKHVYRVMVNSMDEKIDYEKIFANNS